MKTKLKVKTKESMKRKQIVFNTSKEDHHLIKTWALRKKMTMREFIIECVALFIKKEIE